MFGPSFCYLHSCAFYYTCICHSFIDKEYRIQDGLTYDSVRMVRLIGRPLPWMKDLGLHKNKGFLGGVCVSYK